MQQTIFNSDQRFFRNECFESGIIEFVVYYKIRYMNPSGVKYTEEELRKQLKRENIGDTTLYYSLVKKDGKNLSFFYNERLLIYDINRRMLYYNNDFKNTPFRTVVPQPKNGQFTPLNHTTFKNPSGTSQLMVRYAGKNTKDEMEVIQWTFTCQSENLAQQWMNLIDQEKNKLVSQLTGQKNAGFVHDTLIDVLGRSHHRQEAPKETILKPEEQLIKSNPLQQQRGNVLNSRLSKKDPLQKSELRQSNNAELPINIGESTMMRNTRNQQNQSRLFMEHSQTNKMQTNSVIKEKESMIKSRDPSHVSQKKVLNVDWNGKFLKNPYESTIFEFERAALSAFRAIWERDSSQLRGEKEQKGLKGAKGIFGIRVYQSEGLRVAVSNMFSEQARQLKREFRNYHFILESCKDRWIVGVPMSFLIEWQGTVALVKAPLPYQCLQVRLLDAINEVRELERYTRVGNAILENCTLWDATEVYGAIDQKRLIYVDNLAQYLPQNTNENISKCTLRPEYMLDSVSQITPGGEVKPSNRQQFKTLSTVCDGVVGCVKQLAKHLSSQQALWVDALQLKQIFHSFGVNLKYLPIVYSQATNKQVKRYLQSVMAAKVAKDLINQICLQARMESQVNNPADLYQDCLRSFVQDSNASSQFWKDLSIRFKKQFGIPLSNSQLVGGFFLNSLIKLLRITCDAGKLDQSKKLFKEQGIVGAGFVIAVQPKSKSYYRFTGDFIEKVKYACKQQKKDQQLYQEIVNTLQLENKPIPQEYSQGSSSQCILEYLSYYTAPKNLDSNAPLQKIPIYSSIFRQPPNSFVLKLSRNYLYWCVKKDRPEQFKKGIENALRMSDYWLEDSHLFQCSLYQLLSDFCAGQGNGEESIRYMKQSLSRCIRVCGTQAKLAGAKYYELGQRQLKVGHKKQALQNFAKAKTNMQSNQNQSIKYPQLLMRLAALQLNSGSVEACIEGSLHAIKQFEEYDKRSGSAGMLTEAYKIKTFEVLSRAYEINERREELKEMALLCAKKFNRSRSEWTFEQMIRICLAAVIYHSSLQHCQHFLKLLNKLLQQQSVEQGEALRQLMALSQSTVVMQRFINRFQTIQRVLPEGQSKRGYSPQTKEFILICRLLAGSVGEDYIEGLVQQKQYD